MSCTPTIKSVHRRTFAAASFSAFCFCSNVSMERGSVRALAAMADKSLLGPATGLAKCRERHVIVRPTLAHRPSRRARRWLALPMPFTSTMPSTIDSRVQSPRPGTPEPSSRQGRRNTEPDAQLLDDDGAISQKVSDEPVSLENGALDAQVL